MAITLSSLEGLTGTHESNSRVGGEGQHFGAVG